MFINMDIQGDVSDLEKHKCAYIIRVDTEGIDSVDFEDDEDRLVIVDAKALSGHIDDTFKKVLLMNSHRVSQFLLGGARVSAKSLSDICCEVLPKLRQYYAT